MLCCHFLLAQPYILSGTINNERGEILPFALLHVKNSGSGSITNENGFYRILLEKGENTLTVQFNGYQPKTVMLNIRRDTVANFVLVPQRFSSTAFKASIDIAANIIRKTIANKQIRKEAIKNYSVDVYMKGVQKMLGAPRKLVSKNVARALNLDSTGKGILYLSEANSKVYYKQPDRYREAMISNKKSGQNQSLNFNKATDLTADFYKNMLQFDELSVKGFISPIADIAFKYYNYKLLGQFIENGHTVDKIEVVPKHVFAPAFKGEIYIVEGAWQLYSINLTLTKSANINFADTVSFKQQYLPVTENIWMPAVLHLNFKGKVLGFLFDGYFLNIYSKYFINETSSDHFFNGEIFKIAGDAEKKDKSYWASVRKVPLNANEEKNYQLKDSLQSIEATRHYKDSLDNQNNTVTPLKLGILGIKHTSTVHNTTFTFAPILPGIFYNTVEGFGYQYQMTFKKEYNLKNFIDITPKLRYGFGNNHFNSSIETRYFYDPVNKGFLSFKAGSEVLDISNLRSSTSLSNSINTLIYETNNNKFYEKTLVNFGGSYEAATGLFGTASIEFSQRRPLNNASTYSLLDRKNKYFTSNNPFFPDQDILLFQKHNAFTLLAELDYAPAARFVSKPEGKFYEPFKYPRLLLTYRKGFKSILGSDVDFDFASIEIYQTDLRMGMWGKSSYTLKIGKFFNNSSIFYPDFNHFQGNSSLIFEGSLRNFHWLDLYQNSTDQQFLEAHYEHSIGGFLINKIPLVRRLKLEEIMGGAFLDRPANKNYYEVFFGLQRLILRIDYAIAFTNDIKVFNGFKFTYHLK